MATYALSRRRTRRGRRPSSPLHLPELHLPELHLPELHLPELRMPALRQPPPRRSRAVLLAVPAAGVAGAVLAYLFDPQRGKARRRRLVEQTLARTRRQARELRAKERYARGRAQGLVARSRGGGRPHPQDDVDVKQQAHQALSSAGIPLARVSVEVSKATAVLRGELETDRDIAQAQEVVAHVPGVTAVRNYLHLPGEIPPNKASVLTLSHS